MSTEVSTDATQLVEEAFAELECCATTTNSPHDGDNAAYHIGHGCFPDGFVCHGHMRRHIEVRLPEIRRKLAAFGFITCARCKRKFVDAESFAKVFPL